MLYMCIYIYIYIYNILDGEAAGGGEDVALQDEGVHDGVREGLPEAQSTYILYAICYICPYIPYNTLYYY